MSWNLFKDVCVVRMLDEQSKISEDRYADTEIISHQFAEYAPTRKCSSTASNSSALLFYKIYTRPATTPQSTTSIMTVTHIHGTPIQGRQRFQVASTETALFVPCAELR
jgi:hypothetical protein